MTEFTVQTLSRKYPVLIENGCLSKLPGIASSLSDSTDLLIITDQNIVEIYREKIDSLFHSENLHINWIVIPAGESSKNFKTYETIIGILHELGLHRNGLLIALGGGVVCDITGFVSSTWMRGVRWLCVPTSLLGMVDASIGGKTGIHFANVKNLIGTFHQPVHVLIDPVFLETLDETQFLSGAAEVIKMALIPGGENLPIHDSNSHAEFFRHNPETMQSVIEQCCRLKASIVEKDEFDHGGRIVLNLGHTVGHALESHGKFKSLTHGQAVSVGVLFISEVSVLNGDMPKSDLERIYQLFDPVLKQIPIPEIQWKELIPFMSHDKKREESSLRFVYPLGIGRIAIRDISPDELELPWRDFLAKLVRMRS